MAAARRDQSKSKRVRTVILPKDAPNNWESMLEPGERLLWSGSPGQGVRLHGKDWVISAFTALWTGLVGVVLVRELGGWQAGVEIKLGHVAILGTLLLIGLYLTIGRFFWDASKRARSRYALTDKRAMVATTSGRRRLTTFSLATDVEALVKDRSQSVFLLAPPDYGARVPVGHLPRPHRHARHPRDLRPGIVFAFIGAGEAERVKALADEAIAALGDSSAPGS